MKEFNENLVHQATQDGIQKIVVGAVVKRGSHVLLLRRKAEDFMGGRFELPSGGVEAGEQLHDALERELNEETGLKLKLIEGYLGHFDYLSGSGRRTRQFNFRVSVHSPHEIRLTEHDQHAWATRPQLSDFNITDSTRRIILSRRRRID